MTKFSKGDSITNGNGDIATVLDTPELILLQWADGTTGTWDAKFFEKIERKFSVGDHVRSVAYDTLDVVGMVIDDDYDDEENDPYTVALYDPKGEELSFSASELIPWVPRIGELVLEVGVDDDTEGAIVAVSGDEAMVLWDGFPFAQKFALADLEPVDECDSDDDFEVGEIVTYSNPIFSGTAQAKVLEVDGDVIRVAFEPGTIIADGDYSKDYFSKAA